MCGIAGAVAIAPDARPDRARVEAMSRRIAHRGPDGEGTWVAPSGRAILAHRRLAIIDLVTGDQPMISADGSVGLVFNGEIYNYQELRAGFAPDAAPFRTDSDTEVLLRVLQRDGAAGLHALRGMFAFALWDERSGDERSGDERAGDGSAGDGSAGGRGRGRLLLARDRLGKKPLYHATEDGVLYFASSLGAIEDAVGRGRGMDHDALGAYLALGYVPAPMTALSGVRKLSAGSTLAVVHGGRRGSVSTATWWDLAPAPPAFEGTYAQALDTLDGLVNDAVRLRLRSDVPLGVFLSGGIDSSLVTAVAARHSTTPVLTFAIGMDVAAADESAYAEAVAKFVGTEHRAFRAHPDLLAMLPTLVHHYGEPFADASALPTWLLAEQTRAHVTVAVGGDGGDESFAGYSWYRTAARLNDIASRGPSGLGSGVRSRLLAMASVAASRLAPRDGGGRLGRGQRALAVLAEPSDAERFAALRSLFTPADTRALSRGALREACTERSIARDLRDRYLAASGSALRRMRYVDITTYLADCLLPKVDVATMAHGLEARAPLLDQDVVTFGMSLPDAWLSDPRSVESGGKRILRDLLARYLPRHLFERPKQGFVPPLAEWFIGTARERITALSGDGPLMDSGWFDRRTLRTMVDAHMGRRRDHTSRLYALLVLDAWLRQR